jgi:hypothetical protein
MKTMTTTKATHRGVDILVMSDKIGYQTMYTCTNSRSRGIVEEKWFPTRPTPRVATALHSPPPPILTLPPRVFQTPCRRRRERGNTIAIKTTTPETIIAQRLTTRDSTIMR